MTHSRLILVAAVAALCAAAQSISVPPVPPNLKVPDGNVAYLKTSAIGTQNYVCVPGTTGPTWKFLGPQATVYVKFQWLHNKVQQQVMTHFLSTNPLEGGTQRPSWHHSVDSSMVWAKSAASSSDPAYVAADSVPWLLLEIAGATPGPMGGSGLLRTTYIQRLNTAGGIAPTTGCDAGTHGNVALVPYTTEYYSYEKKN